MYQEPTFPRGGKIVKPKKDKEEEPKQKKKTKVVVRFTLVLFFQIEWTELTSLTAIWCPNR